MVGVSQVILVIKNLLANAGDVRDTGSIPGSGRSPEGGPGHLLQQSCLENPVDRGDWLDTVFRIAKSWTQLKRLSAQHSTVCGQRQGKSENECVSRSLVSNSLQAHGLQLARLLHPWNFPGKNTGVGCHFLLQGQRQWRDFPPPKKVDSVLLIYLCCRC